MSDAAAFDRRDSDIRQDSRDGKFVRRHNAAPPLEFAYLLINGAGEHIAVRHDKNFYRVQSPVHYILLIKDSRLEIGVVKHDVAVVNPAAPAP